MQVKRNIRKAPVPKRLSYFRGLKRLQKLQKQKTGENAFQLFALGRMPSFFGFFFGIKLLCCKIGTTRCLKIIIVITAIVSF